MSQAHPPTHPYQTESDHTVTEQQTALTGQQLDDIEAVVRNAAVLGADIDPATAAALLDEARWLRARVAELEKAQRLEWLRQGVTPHTPRICECGHSHHAHTVPEPHSCFAHGKTCPCPAYRQMAHDEAVAHVTRKQAEYAAAPAVSGAADSRPA